MDHSRTPKKPGPRPKGFERIHIFLPPDLAEWAKSHMDGVSGLARRLFVQEREREHRASRHP